MWGMGFMLLPYSVFVPFSVYRTEKTETENRPSAATLVPIEHFIFFNKTLQDVLDLIFMFANLW
jgi:hypothetical protein